MPKCKERAGAVNAPRPLSVHLPKVSPSKTLEESTTEAAINAFVKGALKTMSEMNDPETKQRRLIEIEEARKHQRGPKRKITKAKLREQIRLDGGAKARKKVVAEHLKVDVPTLWRWLKSEGFLSWKEACWWYAKYDDW